MLYRGLAEGALVGPLKKKIVRMLGVKFCAVFSLEQLSNWGKHIEK